MKKALIYGAGKVFVNSFINSNFAATRLMMEGYKIAGITDKFGTNEDKWANYHFYQREVALQSDYDEIIVTSTKYYMEIRNELIELGIPVEKIHSYKELQDKWYKELFFVSQLAGQQGLEIGGPTGMFSSIYRACQSCDNVNFSANTVWWQKGAHNSFIYDGREIGNVYIADAVDLGIIEDESYDFILSSNNLEHIANPMRALKEWYRILRMGGIIILVVPRREVTFDHTRPYTTFEHLLQDYETGVGEDDLSHLPEIQKLHDYAMDVACGGREQFLRRAQKNIENRCLHHHVFSEACLKALWKYFGLTILDFEEIPGNYCIIGKK